MIDGSAATKYLNFGKLNTGLIITPAYGTSTVNGFRITTANDAESRDPTSWVLYGTNATIASRNNSTGDGEAWTQIDQGTVDLQQVRLGFRDSTGTEWTALAERGQLTQASGVVQLAGNVRVHGLAPDSGEPAEITSEHLAFDTRAQLVSTRDPVTVLMSGRELHAQGLLAGLKERHLQLESGVHGSFSRLP